MEILASALPGIQIILSLILVALILLQRSEAGLGSAFGGGDGNLNFNKKRGLEKTLFNFTIIVAILWVGGAILALFF